MKRLHLGDWAVVVGLFLAVEGTTWAAGPAPQPPAPRLPAPTREQVKLAPAMRAIPRRPVTPEIAAAHEAVSAKAEEVKAVASTKAALARASLSDPVEAAVAEGRAYRRAGADLERLDLEPDGATALNAAAGAYRRAGLVLEQAARRPPPSIEAIEGHIEYIKKRSAAARVETESKLRLAEGAFTARVAELRKRPAHDVAHAREEEYAAHVRSVKSSIAQDQADPSAAEYLAGMREHLAWVTARGPEQFPASYAQSIATLNRAMRVKQLQRVDDVGKPRPAVVVEAVDAAVALARRVKAEVVSLGPERYEDDVLTKWTDIERAQIDRMVVLAAEEADLAAPLAERAMARRLTDRNAVLAKAHNLLVTADVLDERAKRLVAAGER